VEIKRAMCMLMTTSMLLLFKLVAIRDMKAIRRYYLYALKYHLLEMIHWLVDWP